jgi:hypothetical protein
VGLSSPQGDIFELSFLGVWESHPITKWKPTLLLMLESVRTETKTSRGYKSPRVFIEVVLLYYDFRGTLGLQNVGLLQKSFMIFKEKVKMKKRKMFLFSFKESS